MAYVAILNYVNGTVEGLESYADGTAALDMRRTMYITEAAARGSQNAVPFYGASPPAAPAARGYTAPPAQNRRVIVRQNGTVIEDLTYSTHTEAMIRYEGVRRYAQMYPEYSVQLL